MKLATPPKHNISTDAKKFMYECASEFMEVVFQEAKQQCHKEGHDKLTGDQFLQALGNVGLQNYYEYFNVFLRIHRENQNANADGNPHTDTLQPIGSAEMAQQGTDLVQPEPPGFPQPRNDRHLPHLGIPGIDRDVPHLGNSGLDRHFSHHGIPGMDSHLPNLGIPGNDRRLPHLGTPGNDRHLHHLRAPGNDRYLPHLGIPETDRHLPQLGIPEMDRHLPHLGIPEIDRHLRHLRIPEIDRHMPHLEIRGIDRHLPHLGVPGIDRHLPHIGIPDLDRHLPLQLPPPLPMQMQVQHIPQQHHGETVPNHLYMEHSLSLALCINNLMQPTELHEPVRLVPTLLRLLLPEPEQLMPPFMQQPSANDMPFSLTLDDLNFPVQLHDLQLALDQNEEHEEEAHSMIIDREDDYSEVCTSENSQTE